MKAVAVKSNQQTKSEAVANSVSQKKKNGHGALEFVDNRAETFSQTGLRLMINNGTRMVAQRKQLRDAFGMPVQRQIGLEEGLLQGRFSANAAPSSWKYGPGQLVNRTVIRDNMQRNVSPRVHSSHSTSSTIQMNVAKGVGHRQLNHDLVDTVLNCTTFGTFGETPVQLNHEEFPGGDASAAIIAPLITVTPDPYGRAMARVTVMPLNNVDHRIELPTAPPWQRVAAKDHAASAVEMLTGGFGDELQSLRESTGANVTLEVRGLPDDAGFANLVEQHENHHVDDWRRSCDEILVPWDTNLQMLFDSQDPCGGDNGPKACHTVYTLASGTPEEIGRRMENAYRERGEAYHDTPEGGSPIVENVEVNTMLNLLTLTWRHPQG